MKDTKMCKRCGFRFSLDAYGKNTSSKDGLDSYCRPCRKQINKINYEKRRAGFFSVEEPSTLLGRAILSQQGIPCVTGRSGGLPHIDLLAWGCVPIDSKISFPNHGDVRKYGWTIKQRQVDSGSLFLCIAITPEKLRVFVVPIDVLYVPTKHRIVGKDVPTALRVTFGSDHFNAYSEDTISKYENRFDLIEKARESYKPTLFCVDTIVKDAWKYYKVRHGRKWYDGDLTIESFSGY